MNIDPNSPQNLIQRRVFDDPTGGMIQQRVMVQFTDFIQKTDLSKSSRQSLMELLVVVAVKFVSIWTHDQRFEAGERQLIEEARRSPQDRRGNTPIKLATAQDLYIEFDGFLVQVKSVLDHMINVLHYTLELDFSGLTTFGDYGNKIVNQLQKNVSKKKEGLQGAAKILIEHIQQNQWWLKVVIESRDRMNHYKNGGLSPLPFTVACIIDADGTEQLYRPTFSPGNLVKDEMSVIFRSLFDFVEYFIGVAFAPRMNGYGIKFNRTPDVTKPQWSVLPDAVIRKMYARGEVPPEEMRDL
jgi:hypothetical protein